MTSRELKDRIFRLACLGTVIVGVALLCVLVFSLAAQGLGGVTLEFLSNYPSRRAETGGIYAAIFGTLWLMGLTAVISIPIGLAVAVVLTEYNPRTPAWKKFFRTLELNIANLAGVPSVIFGLLGLAVFVRTLGLGRSLLSGALTLSLLVLPVVVISTTHALRSVPVALRMAAYAVGAPRLSVIFGQVLPAALPGIMTGVILAMSRAIGETAPLIIIGAVSFITFVPASPMDSFTIIPLQIFNWASRPQEEFHRLAASAIVVLLVVLFVLNFAAIWLRERSQKNLRGL